MKALPWITVLLFVIPLCILRKPWISRYLFLVNTLLVLIWASALLGSGSGMGYNFAVLLLASLTAAHVSGVAARSALKPIYVTLLDEQKSKEVAAPISVLSWPRILLFGAIVGTIGWLAFLLSFARISFVRADNVAVWICAAVLGIAVASVIRIISKKAINIRARERNAK